MLALAFRTSAHKKKCIIAYKAKDEAKDGVKSRCRTDKDGLEKWKLNMHFRKIITLKYMMYLMGLGLLFLGWGGL